MLYFNGREVLKSFEHTRSVSSRLFFGKALFSSHKIPEPLSELGSFNTFFLKYSFLLSFLSIIYFLYDYLRSILNFYLLKLIVLRNKRLIRRFLEIRIREYILLIKIRYVNRLFDFYINPSTY